MKTKVLKYNLAGRSQVFVVSLLALLRKTGLAGEETSGAIPAEVLDTLKIQLVSPNVTGAQILTTKLTRPCHYSVEGNELTIALGELNPGQHRLTVKSVYGTNTRSLLIIDATVPVGDGETSEAINIDVAAVSSITPNDSEIVEDVETLKGEMSEAQGAIESLQEEMPNKASKAELQEAIDESLEEIKEEMQNLPDGQAVSAQVALNTTAIEGLQGDVSQLGQYIDNPEWVQVVTDSDDKILYGVKSDGKFYFGNGCPPQVVEYITNYLGEVLGSFNAEDYADIKTFLGDLIDGDTLATLLNAKVDKVVGKSLIDAEFASSQEVIDNPEWIAVTTDSEGKVLEGVTADGKKKVMLETTFQGKTIGEIASNEFVNKSTLDKFSEQSGKLLWNGAPIEGSSVSALVVDLPVSDGTGIESGYAYIDIADRTIKVKA